MQLLNTILKSAVNLIKQLGLVIAISVTATMGLAQSIKQLTEVCSSCHGPSGISPLSGFPNLANQGEIYLYDQLLKIKNKFRVIPVMQGQLDNLSNDQLREIAKYYATAEPAKNVAKDKDIDLGRSIYRAGIASKGVPACSACHGPSGKGIEGSGFPAVAGQWSEYSLMSFQRFTDADSQDPAFIMKAITDKMTQRELQAVANYIQGLR